MTRHAHSHAVAAPAEVLDPVCGMTISPDDAVGHVNHKGETYYFCSQSCLDQFRATPDAFLGERPVTPTTSADMEREYTCPMDPEVRQKGPGACPKCGSRVFEHGVAYVCEKAVGSARSCDFRSGRLILQQPIERTQMKKLLETGRTDLLTGFVSKKNRKFKAFLVKQPDGKIGFEFQARPAKEAPAEDKPTRRGSERRARSTR